jgi:hypothetical protein
MRHTLRFRTGDDGSILLEEPTLAYGLACGHERGAAELGIAVGRRVRMELLDDADRLLDWRTYVAAATGGQFPRRPVPGRMIPGAVGLSAGQARRLQV